MSSSHVINARFTKGTLTAGSYPGIWSGETITIEDNGAFEPVELTTDHGPRGTVKVRVSFDGVEFKLEEQEPTTPDWL